MRRKGALLWGVPGKQFHLFTSEDNLTTCKFNKEVVEHRFCSTCGCHPYGQGHDSSSDDFVMVNVRCLEGVDLASLTVQH
jgi:hypothetical protein